MSTWKGLNRSTGREDSFYHFGDASFLWNWDGTDSNFCIIKDYWFWFGVRIVTLSQIHSNTTTLMGLFIPFSSLFFSAKLDPPKKKVKHFFLWFTQPQNQISHRTGFNKAYNLQPNLHTVCRASFRIASCKAFLSAWQDLNGSWYVTSTGLTKMIWIVQHGQRSNGDVCSNFESNPQKTVLVWG